MCGTACKGFPGPGCALCCAAFSVWGILGLLVIGILFSANYYHVANGAVNNMSNAALSAYLGVILYFLCAAGCGVRFWKVKSRWNEEEVVVDAND